MAFRNKVKRPRNHRMVDNSSLLIFAFANYVKLSGAPTSKPYQKHVTHYGSSDWPNATFRHSGKPQASGSVTDSGAFSLYCTPETKYYMFVVMFKNDTLGILFCIYRNQNSATLGKKGMGERHGTWLYYEEP